MGVMAVNDRCVSLLENYDVEVLRTWRGRGCILCETNSGTLILKEYGGHKEKSVFQDAVLGMIKKRGFSEIESIIRNKEGELLTVDSDGVCYILKTYFDGRECNVHDMEECRLAMSTLARLHKASHMEEGLPRPGGSFTVGQEFEKHNRELRRVRKFLREKGQKTDFEIYLMQCYDYFFQLALQTAEDYNRHAGEADGDVPRIVCHGDFQHHNLIFEGDKLCVINFEKCVPDSPVRDIYLFMRKLLEKSDWAKSAGFLLLDAYEKENRLTREEHVQLCYRLSYPEKFWKIVNFYYNTGKAWIPGKNMEKLEKIHLQEKEKINFLQAYKKKYDILI